MRFPLLQPRSGTTLYQEVFAGYNHNLRIADNEFYHMENLTSDLYPVLSCRNPRGLYARDPQVQGMIAKDSLCYVSGRDLVINGYRVDMKLSTDPESCPKQLVSMGAYLIILPDRKYLNTADLTDFGPIEASFSCTGVQCIPCHADGTAYTPDYVQPEAPTGAPNLSLWMDTGTTPHSLKQYSASLGLWNALETTYLKLQYPGIGKAFRQYDGVTLRGFGDLEDPQLQALEGAAVIMDCRDSELILTGVLDGAVTVDTSLTISREMPLMDYLVECDNRLWGCRYGLSREGFIVNELYACAPGDFKNWNRFLGISTDSYRVSLGADGVFTGAAVQGGHPLFFRENCLHKIYGQIPANFQVQTLSCRGVQKDCSRSLAIVGEVLYYKSRQGVCAYDGSLPREVDAALGQNRYTQAVAAALDSKYYISMVDCQTGQRSLFVLDTARGLWHREDALPVYLLCTCREELYCATEDGRILTLLGSGEASGETVQWMLETGILGGSLPGKKSLTKLNLQLALETGSHLRILVQYDSQGPWHQVGYLTGTQLRSFCVPLKPRRCDHLRLRLEGSGPMRLYRISKTYTRGSDV